MKATLDIGAEVDILSGDEARRIMRAELGRRVKYPILRPVLGAVTVAGNVGMIDLGQPPTGAIWSVRRLAIAQSNLTGNPAGKVFIMRGQLGPTPPSNANVDASQVVDGSALVPATFYWGRQEFVIQGNQHLYVVFLATDNVAMVVTGDVEEQIEGLLEPYAI